LTDQNYKELVVLDKKYRAKGLVIQASPCDQFGGQEPGTPSEIKAFVAKYGATFPFTEKLSVNGAATHPLFAHLKASAPESGLLALAGTDIKWNFAKFLIDKNGKTIKRYAPTESPLSFENDIVAALNK